MTRNTRPNYRGLAAYIIAVVAVFACHALAVQSDQAELDSRPAAHR